jgi:hypothetical protein
LWLRFYRQSAVRGRTTPGFNPIGSVSDWYRNWKLQRNKKKFQVYLRKHGSDRDPWVH